MDIFLFFKTLADMFYAVPVFDYLLLIVAIAFFIVALRNIEEYYPIDYLVFAFMIMLSITFVRSFSGFDHYIKMLSAFMLYFIGRGYNYDIEKVKNALVKSYTIVLLLHILLFLLGIGFINWGNSLTFRGLYYFKTDFSMAMIFAISTIVFLTRIPVKYKILTWIIIEYLIIRSNTRAALLISFIVFGIWLISIREELTGAKITINIKYVVWVLLGLFVGIILLTKILSLPVFEKYSFISFKFNSLSELYSDANTQGRNHVWENIFKIYENSSIVDKLVGIDYISDRWNGYDSHNGYLKILFTTGIIGLGIFIGIIVIYIKALNDIKDRCSFYFNISIIISFLLASISQSSIDFTQMTWIVMFFIGNTISQVSTCEQDKSSPTLIEDNFKD